MFANLDEEEIIEESLISARNSEELSPPSFFHPYLGTRLPFTISPALKGVPIDIATFVYARDTGCCLLCRNTNGLGNGKDFEMKPDSGSEIQIQLEREEMVLSCVWGNWWFRPVSRQRSARLRGYAARPSTDQ